MATVEENRRYWDEIYSWEDEGEEWSRGWGSTKALWTASLKPRIARFLPASTILEIAPGFGRFTELLAAESQTYIGVDLSRNCVDACRARFAHLPSCAFHVNDGETLPMVEDASVDFAFSFFSLIHAQEKTVRSYLEELRRTLKPEGGAFLHHSNLAQHAAYFGLVEQLPAGLRKRLFDWGLLDLPQWREPTMSATLFGRCAQDAGLAILSQETVNFGSRRTIDAFTSLVRADGPWAHDGSRWDNPGFMHEAMRVRLKPQRRPGVLPERFYGPLKRA